MQRGQKRWAIFVGFSFLVLLEILSWGTASLPSPCIVKLSQPEQAAYHYGDKECPTFAMGSLVLFGRLDHFIEEHDKSIVAGFTVVLAISTIMLWGATKEAAVGGERAAKIAEDALTKLERAFVSFAFNVAGVRDSNDPNTVIGWQISPIWKNSGKTPTKGLHAHVSWDHFPTELPLNFTFPDIWLDPNAPRINPPSYIGPLDSVGSDTLIISSAHLEAARQGHIHIYIWGWVEYDDVFENTPPHRTEFCHHVMVGSDPYVFMENVLPFGLAVYGIHTGADEECYRQPRPREQRSQSIV